MLRPSASSDHSGKDSALFEFPHRVAASGTGVTTTTPVKSMQLCMDCRHLGTSLREELRHP